MMLHEYGSYSYSIKDSYLEITEQGKLDNPSYYYVSPLFTWRKQFLAFSQLYQIRCFISHINDTKYTKEERGFFSKIIAVHSLLNQGYSRASIWQPENLMNEINSLIKKILEDAEFRENAEYMRKHAQKLFRLRFDPSSMAPMIENKWVEFLEKDRQYDLAVFLLLNLLMKRVKKHKRAKWWYRLAIDLSHMGKTVEAFWIWYKALKDDKTIDNGKRNCIVLYQKVLRKSIFRIYNERDSKIEKLSKQLTLKNFKKRISKSTFEIQKQKILDSYFPQLNLISKLDLDSLFVKEFRTSKERNNYKQKPLKILGLKWEFMERITEQKYDFAHFKERYLKCPRAKTENGEGMGTIYRNQKTKEVYGVEELALTYYCKKEGYSGIHSENGFGITLFGLFMWDQIFDNTIPSVFQSPHQFAPLDYGSNEFYYHREDKILKRLQQIKEMSPEEISEEVRILWETHKYKHNWAINWDSINFSQKKLMDITACMGGEVIARILKKYCYDYKNWNHGMPDLLLWNSKTRKIKFSEVKSEFDNLSDVQKGWLEYLSKCGIHVEVCYVNRRGKEHLAIDAV